MIHEINEDIEHFIREYFSQKDAFRRLCDTCGIPFGELNIKDSDKRVRSFISELEKQGDDYINLLYNSLRALIPNQKRKIDKLFNLFTGFDLVLHELLTELFELNDLQNLCRDSDIPDDIIEGYSDIVDASIVLVYYCKEKGLQEKFVKYLKEKHPKEPRISELENATIRQSENLFLVSPTSAVLK